jgi:hypothetical protein
MAGYDDKITAAQEDAVGALDQADADTANTPAPSEEDVAATAGGKDIQAPAPEEAGAPEADVEAEAGNAAPQDYSDPKLWGVDGPIAKTFQQVEAQGIDPYEAFQTGLQILASQAGQGQPPSPEETTQAGGEAPVPDTTGIQGIPPQGQEA